MKINKKIAKKISYGGKRNCKDIRYIVIHYTSNEGDTAQNNLDYFANVNEKETGAHFLVDKKGKVGKTIAMNGTAWAVGRDYRSGRKGEATYFGKCTNANSVSIELCDCCTDTHWEQMLATRKLVKYIQKKCPNAKTIIRHWDVNGKNCPAPMVGKDNEKWVLFYTFITKGYSMKAKVIKKAAIRSSGKVTPTNKIMTMNEGSIVTIEKIVGNWGRLKYKDAKGRYQWISLNKVKEI